MGSCKVPESNVMSTFSYEEILSEKQLAVLKDEFSRVKDACYLDHGGATLYAKSQLESSMVQLQSTLYSNPHSRNPSSSITTDAVDYVRQRILTHFGTNDDEYSVIFTSGATSALKLVAESFSYNGGLFAYLEESHNSVVGMREFILNNGKNGLECETKSSRAVNSTPGVSEGSNSCLNNGKVYCISKSVMEELMRKDDNLKSNGCGCFKEMVDGENNLNEGGDDGDARSQNEGPDDTKICTSCSASEETLPTNSTTPTCRGTQEDETNVSRGDTESDISTHGCNGDLFRNQKMALMAYPAQCNFSGVKYPLEWIGPIQTGHLEGISQIDQFYLEGKQDEKEEIHLIKNSCRSASNTKTVIKDQKQRWFLCPKCSKTFTTTEKEEVDEKDNLLQRHKWFVVLDAASFVASNRLDLSIYKPDFVALSFYKMFGWPTGLGALLVRNESAYVLNSKPYFGGGTVNISIPSLPFHVKRAKLHERFEDGTISFLSILAVRHGLDTLTRLSGSMDIIRTRTFRLAQYFYQNLSCMKYPNGQPVARIYSDSLYTSEKTQGPVVTFNLLRADGSIIGYSEMEQIAYLHDVHMRYGCFCNPGACRRHLGLTPEQVLKHFEAGHVCGDMRDIIDGQPTGAIRVSFGYMTPKENADYLLELIQKCWILPFSSTRDQKNSGEDPMTELSNGARRSLKERRLVRIFVYPIKSCAPFEVKSTWALGPHGLLYDREWLIVNSSGVPLTAKREPRLCQIQPRIDITNRRLELRMEGFDETVSVPLDMNETEYGEKSFKAEMCASKVCGDTVLGLDCGEQVSQWLSDILDKPGLKLIRMSPDHHRKPRNSLDEISLANQSQFLLLSMGSLRQLAKELISKGVLPSILDSTTTTSTNITPNTTTTTMKREAKTITRNGHHQTNVVSHSADEPYLLERKHIFSNYDEGDRDQDLTSSLLNEERLIGAKDQGKDATCGGSGRRNESNGKFDHFHQEDWDHMELLIEKVVESLIGRFRANFVVSGQKIFDNKNFEELAYEEELWKEVQIGSTSFQSGGPCIRCATICMDPETGTRSSEPLLTLSATRGGRPNFGIHLYALPTQNGQCNPQGTQGQSFFPEKEKLSSQSSIKNDQSSSLFYNSYNSNSNSSSSPSSSSSVMEMGMSMMKNGKFPLSSMHIGDIVQVTSATNNSTTTTSNEKNGPEINGRRSGRFNTGDGGVHPIIKDKKGPESKSLTFMTSTTTTTNAIDHNNSFVPNTTTATMMAVTTYMKNTSTTRTTTTKETGIGELYIRDFETKKSMVGSSENSTSNPSPLSTYSGTDGTARAKSSRSNSNESSAFFKSRNGVRDIIDNID